MPRSPAIKPRHYFLVDVNPVIRFLVISDIIIVGAAGLLGPIFALFVEDFIHVDDTAAVAGVAAAIYLFTKSIAQIPAARMIDAVPGERDDFQVLFWSSVVMGLLPIMYLFIEEPWELYGVQALIGIATAFSFPSFMAIFTRHIDHRNEGTEWGVYFTLTDLAHAAAAAIGGVLASTIGFDELIIALVILNVIGTFIILPIAKSMRRR